jgi:hypothetical protein
MIEFTERLSGSGLTPRWRLELTRQEIRWQDLLIGVFLRTEFSFRCCSWALFANRAHSQRCGHLGGVMF